MGRAKAEAPPRQPVIERIVRAGCIHAWGFGETESREKFVGMLENPGCNAARNRACWVSDRILSNSLSSLRASFRFVVDLLVPHDCFVCGHESGGVVLCTECAGELPVVGPACPMCALPSPGAMVCGACLSAPPAFDATFAAFPYAFPIDRMVQALKYRYRLSVVPFLAEALIALGPVDGVDRVLPMPLHVKRLRERGFNQAVELARPLARVRGLPLELVQVGRVLDVAPQMSLSWRERQSNMRGVFACAGRFDGAHVLVVDDVMTTGATLHALAAVLKKQGASRVTNLVVARTPRMS